MKEKKKYQVICETWTEDGEECPCYGLVCEDLQIHYVSTDRSFVEGIADTLNGEEVEPENALDRIESLLP